MWDKVEKEAKRFKRNLKLSSEFETFRQEWKVKGPVEFALQQLKTDPNTGMPIVFSDDQKEFLTDLWKGNVKLAIITAGRGSGKTFALAVYVIWRIMTHENWHIACLGGSQEQSDKIHSYIVHWVQSCEWRKYFLRFITSEVKTHANASATFHACSGTSVRSPHTHEIIIDEQAAAEERGGEKYVKAAIWEVSTSPDLHIIRSSTAHYIHGEFLQIWNNANKLGYKKYQWAIAKHISGEKDSLKIYKDTNPNHWMSNLPWMPNKNAGILRQNKSNDEWLVEALGGISISSGLVFNPLDIGACACDRPECDICEPWKDGVCFILQVIFEMAGIPPEKISLKASDLLKFITNRVLGIDWGKNAPSAFIVLGLFKDWVIVLDHVEMAGLTDQEKIFTALDLAQKWQVEIIRPDPEQWSLNNILSEKGYAVHELLSFGGGRDKYIYLATLKKYVERHKLLIPKPFENLIRSLKNLSFDEGGKIRKKDDHSADACMYAISYYDELEDVSTFWEGLKGEKKGNLMESKQ